mmetsp:Transcript_19179/g.52939  ORF Transcript_19179/g.52939 Transcript_19179/m.52939 type:complete len:663 (+) Transcript_19179:104-2092(+)
MNFSLRNSRSFLLFFAVVASSSVMWIIQVFYISTRLRSPDHQFRFQKSLLMKGSRTHIGTWAISPGNRWLLSKNSTSKIQLPFSRPSSRALGLPIGANVIYQEGKQNIGEKMQPGIMEFKFFEGSVTLGILRPEDALSPERTITPIAATSDPVYTEPFNLQEITNIPDVTESAFIRRIWIWGERCSCTTALMDALSENFDLDCNLKRRVTRWDPGTGWRVDTPPCISPGIPWKHGFFRRARHVNEENALNLLVTRHPYEWADSLRRVAPHMNLHKMQPMERFLTMEHFTLDVANEEHHLDEYLRLHPPTLQFFEGRSEAGKPRRRARHLLESSGLDRARSSDADSGGQSSPRRRLAPASQARPSDPAKGLHRFPVGEWQLAFRNATGGVRAKAPNLRRDPTANQHLAQIDKVIALTPMALVAANESVAAVDKELKFMRRRAAAAIIAAARSLEPINPPLEVMSERDPDTGRRFPTVMAMRERKLRDWVDATAQGRGGEAARVRNAAHIACRDFMLDPGSVLDMLEKKFRLPRSRRAASQWQQGGCIRKFGRQCQQAGTAQGGEQVWPPLPETPASDPGSKAKAREQLNASKAELRRYYLDMQFLKSFDPRSLAIANAWLDPELEKRFGYRLFDSLERASVPYDQSTRCAVHGSCGELVSTVA